MRFGLLHELPLPRPWEPGAERRAIDELLTLAEAADRAGVDHLWLAEHHFEEERSHLSAPTVLLAAIAQRTQRIRLGVANAPLAPRVQHPARVAEAVATLDLLSGGRVDLGVGVPASGAALAGLGIDRTRAHEDTTAALATIARMLVEEPFTGSGAGPLALPPRNVVPKPLQHPHPPFWLTCTRREDIRRAAERGLGALTLAPLTPNEAGEWVAEYEAVVRSARCVPAGAAVTPRVALVLPLSLDPDAQTARDRIADGAQLRGYAQAHFEAFGAHRPGRTSVAEEFARRRGAVGFGAHDPVAGAIGTPESVRELVRRHAAAGVDQLVFVVQPGGTRHEHALASVRLLGETVVPAFAAEAERADAAKEERLADAVAAALARRPAPPPLDPEYAIGAHDAGPATPPPAPSAPTAQPGSLRARVSQAVASRGEAAFTAFVARADDRRLERTVGTGAGLRALFGAMVQRYVPGSADGFAGALRCELRRADGTVRAWTVEIDGVHARARASAGSGDGAAPRLTLRLPVADFVRLAAGELEPARAVFTGRLELEGDLDVAPRLGELFGREALR